MANIAEIRGLEVSYNGVTVLNIPQLDIAEGERLALIGANGSGKTTLLRILAGAILGDAGDVLIHTPLVGYMPQKPYAFGYTVRKNVELAVKDKSHARQAAASALERVGLAALSEKRGSGLSGGETQRMAFARILAMQSRLLLMDEPTAAADIAAGELLEASLLDYLSESGATLVFSTHEPAQAMKLAERVVVLEDGKIVEAGPVEKVLRCPESEEAKRFLSHWRL